MPGILRRSRDFSSAKISTCRCGIPWHPNPTCADTSQGASRFWNQHSHPFLYKTRTIHPACRELSLLSLSKRFERHLISWLCYKREQVYITTLIRHENHMVYYFGAMLSAYQLLLQGSISQTHVIYCQKPWGHYEWDFISIVHVFNITLMFSCAC